MNRDMLPANMRSKIALELPPVSSVEGLCWGWQNCLNSKGYGCVAFNRKVQLTHRVAYELLVGPIPAGLQIDHLCTNKRCCNPAHLEPVTDKVNKRRTDAANKTRCAQGHEYTEANTMWRKRKGGLLHRGCRQCAADLNRVSRLRRSEVSA